MRLQIPFIGGAYKHISPNINSQRCVNLFPMLDPRDAKVALALYGTPGLTEFCDPSNGSEVRALHPFGSVLYAVVGSSVYSVTTGGTATKLGDITTITGPVYMADNGTQVMIVDSTVYGHYIASGALNDINDADFPDANWVTFQDGYFIVGAESTGKFYISGLYDATAWDSLDFATAERKPDNQLRGISGGRELWIFGSESIEVFYNSGAADFPFDPIPGGFISEGCEKGTPVNIDGTFYWLTPLGQVKRNRGYQAEVISTPHIHHQFSQYATRSDAIGFTYRLMGHVFYVVTFPSERATWVYDLTTDHWHEWRSYTDALNDIEALGRHRANCCVYFNGQWIAGDYFNGKLWVIDADAYKDGTDPIKRIRRTQFIHKDRLFVMFHSLEVEFEAGTGIATGQGDDPQAMLRWSDDGGHTFGNEHWRAMGKMGEYGKRAIWRRLGMSRGRTFELTVTDPVKVVILAAYADIEETRL